MDWWGLVWAIALGLCIGVIALILLYVVLVLLFVILVWLFDFVGDVAYAIRDQFY